MDLGELVGMTPEIIQKVRPALTVCLESSMNKNPIHLGIK